MAAAGVVQTGVRVHGPGGIEPGGGKGMELSMLIVYNKTTVKIA